MGISISEELSTPFYIVDAGEGRTFLQNVGS
jgi:hypothetical protein